MSKEKAAHQALARKYRPQDFEELVGQPAVSQTLSNALTAKRVHHAYLFTGPRGCGKTTSARILAKALNCEKGPTPEPCGECTPCREIALSSCLDVMEMDAASNTGVEDVRQMIIETVALAPARDRYKVFIIDEAPKGKPDSPAVLEWSGVEFVGRMATLIPPARKHLVRYYGALGPRSPLRWAVSQAARQKAGAAELEAGYSVTVLGKVERAARKAVRASARAWAACLWEEDSISHGFIKPRY